jgi:hypothetical protein
MQRVHVPQWVRGRRRVVELEVGEQLGEEEVRPAAAAQDEGVLADPPDARARRPFALDDRPRVDVAQEARAGEARREPRRQSVAEREDVVVVVAPRA